MPATHKMTVSGGARGETRPARGDRRPKMGAGAARDLTGPHTHDRSGYFSRADGDLSMADLTLNGLHQPR